MLSELFAMYQFGTKQTTKKNITTGKVKILPVWIPIYSVDYTCPTTMTNHRQPVSTIFLTSTSINAVSYFRGGSLDGEDVHVIAAAVPRDYERDDD